MSAGILGKVPAVQLSAHARNAHLVVILLLCALQGVVSVVTPLNPCFAEPFVTDLLHPLPDPRHRESGAARTLEAHHLDESLPILRHAEAFLEGRMVVVGRAGLNHESLAVPTADRRRSVVPIAHPHIPVSRRTIMVGRLSMPVNI